MNIVFMGTPDFAVPILKALDERYNILALITQPDRKIGRKQTLQEPPTKRYAKSQNIPIFQPQKVTHIRAAILALKPDIIITAAFGQFLPTALITAPPYGAINVHASLLPDLRGGAPIQRAIERGYQKTGVTIMEMAQAMDAGAIIAQAKIDIAEDETNESLFEKLSHLGTKLLLETLPKYINQELIPHEQDHQKATYAYNIKRAEERLDLMRPAIDIERKIRAFYKEPATYIQLPDGPLKIFKAKWVKTDNKSAPSVVIDVTKDGPLIQCGQDGLVLLEVQPAGKARMSAKQYMNGKGRKTLAPGTKLG